MSKRWLAVLLSLIALLVGVLTILLARGTDPALTNEQLLTYQSDIHPPLSEGGRTVQEGMKPAVDDIRAGTVPAAEIQSWVDSLAAVRGEVVAVEEPEVLRDADRLFIRALDQYIEAARLFGRGQVDQGLDAAKAADKTYDDASRIIQEWRRRLGLGPTAEFPDPR